MKKHRSNGRKLNIFEVSEIMLAMNAFTEDCPQWIKVNFLQTEMNRRGASSEDYLDLLLMATPKRVTGNVAVNPDLRRRMAGAV